MEELKMVTEEIRTDDGALLRKQEEIREDSSESRPFSPAESFEQQEISKLKTSAEIFGVTEKELENEFLDYKIDKLLKQIDYFVDLPVTDLALKEKIMSSKRIGFGSVTVLPDRILTAKQFMGESKTELNTILSYPFGSDLEKVKIYSFKRCMKLPIKSISLPICPLMLNYNNSKRTLSLVKKLKKLSKGKSFKVIADLNAFGQAGLVTLVKLLNEAKVDRISVKVAEGSVSQLKTLLTMTKGKITVDAIGEISLKLGASMLNLGVKRLSASNAEELAEELVEKLKA